MILEQNNYEKLGIKKLNYNCYSNVLGMEVQSIY